MSIHYKEWVDGFAWFPLIIQGKFVWLQKYKSRSCYEYRCPGRYNFFMTKEQQRRIHTYWTEYKLIES